jgi:hypothetical protein
MYHFFPFILGTFWAILEAIQIHYVLLWIRRSVPLLFSSQLSNTKIKKLYFKIF